jgi:hypothetical protein
MESWEPYVFRQRGFGVIGLYAVMARGAMGMTAGNSAMGTVALDR